MTNTTHRKQDEQYELAQQMTRGYSRVLALCERIQERNNDSGEPWEEIVERIIDNHIGDPLEISATLSGVPMSVLHGYDADYDVKDYLDEIEVVLGTGGPARGITFRDDHAYCWHQDWGTPRVHDIWSLDGAEILASYWGIEE